MSTIRKLGVYLRLQRWLYFAGLLYVCSSAPSWLTMMALRWCYDIGLHNYRSTYANIYVKNSHNTLKIEAFDVLYVEHKWINQFVVIRRAF